ncbi:MAG: tetratricopeptide repeat protein, partial [Lysobacteraceae bacterium]
EAELLSQHGRNDEALAAYGRGLAMFDGDTGLLYGRALLLEGMDRIADAETDLRNIIAMEPDNTQALNALGYTLADRTSNYAEAQVLIEHALRLQPDSPAILDSLGWVQHRLGRNAEALHNLRRAFALQKDAEIAAHLGEVLWLTGDKDAARNVWKQGLAIDKENRAMQRVVQDYHP